MTQVPQEIREVFEKAKTIAMSTSSQEAVPNVAYIGMWWWEDDQTICVVNNYMKKTLKNIETNPRVSFAAMLRSQDKTKSYQIKCEAEIQMKGALYDKARKIAAERERPGKSVIVCKVREIYNSSSGESAGDRLA